MITFDFPGNITSDFNRLRNSFSYMSKGFIKVHLIINYMKAKLLIGSLLGLITLLSGCIQEITTNQPKGGLGDEILNIGDAVPKGWDYTITHNFTGEVIPAGGYGKIMTKNSEEMSIPHGLWKPVAIVNFTNQTIESGEASGVYRNPSLWLYFYDITKKQEIMDIIDKEIIYSWCVPAYFDETDRYIIVTTLCNGKSSFPEDFERSLKEYFNRFK